MFCPGCSARNVLCGPKPQRAFLVWHHPYNRKDGDICVEMRDGHGEGSVPSSPLRVCSRVCVEMGSGRAPKCPPFLFLFRTSHSISFTRAQGIPNYKIRFCVHCRGAVLFLSLSGARPKPGGDAQASDGVGDDGEGRTTCSVDPFTPAKPPTMEGGVLLYNCRFCSYRSRHKHHLKTHETVGAAALPLVRRLGSRRELGLSFAPVVCSGSQRWVQALSLSST